MNLEKYISEAISTGRHRNKYNYFPEDRTDKDGIVKWLDGNGFKYMGEVIGDNDLAHYAKSNKQGCYTVGPYDGIPTREWIRFCDGKNVIFIRTCTMSEFNRFKHDYSVLCSITDVKTVTQHNVAYVDVVDYMDNKYINMNR